MNVEICSAFFKLEEGDISNIKNIKYYFV